MPRTIPNPVERYLIAMRTAHSLGTHTAETTFYTPFANLLNTIGERIRPKVHFQAHPGTHGAGLADGGLFPLSRSTQREPLPGQLPERGAVEIKPPGTSLPTLAQSAQVRRYLETYGLCLITNYHQLQLLELLNGQPHLLESYELTATADDLWHLPLGNLAAQHQETLADFLLRVMTRKVPLEKPKDVAWLLASYAREARARAATHPLAAFDGVKSALQESLGITFEGDKGEHFFLSTLIQTLFYGIFSAWILWRRSPQARAPQAVFNWRLSADYLRIPVLRTLFHAVSERGALNTVQIIEVLDHAEDALNRVQPAFFTTFNEEDAVNYFYEPFLEAFDPELRKQLGVWYTPREIVRYMVERVDHLLRSELREPLGLASPNVQVLDPCCGTGAYLVEVLHRIERTLKERAGDDDAFVAADLRRAATSRIFGFEIVPAPFVIAHLQIASLLENAGSSLTIDQRALVFLTNALTGWVPARNPQSNFGFPAFVEERDAADAVKQADTILVILGNPPYNGYAGIAVGEERDLSHAYRAPVDGLPAAQGQGLNELYVRFFRIAERRITQNREHRGVVSFISNYSWLDGLSHPTMRHHLLNSFNGIYIDNLHGDRRISEYAPDGRTSETVFAMQGHSVGIKVGTAVATLVKTGAPVTSSTIGYRDFDDARANERRGRLLASSDETDNYRHITPNRALGLPFKPRAFTNTYLTWPKLPDLFPVSFSGIKTARDTFLVDIDREPLVDRLTQYLDSAIPDEGIAQLFPIIMKDVPRYDARAIRRQLLAQRETELRSQEEQNPRPREISQRKITEANIQPYYYRPFDLRWLYYEHHTKLLDERREEYWNAHRRVPTMISAQANRREYDPPVVTRSLASYHVIERASIIIPISYGVNSAPGVTEEVRNLSNLVPLPGAAADDPDSVFFHALAIMHTPQYRLENAGALLGDWPRIPIPGTAEPLAYSASLGRRLAELLDPESSIELIAEWSFLGRLILAPELPEGAPDRDLRNAARLALTAGWGGAGQGAAVMPRRGDGRERDYTPTELARITTLAATLHLPSEAAVDLLGSRCFDVHLNGASFWTCVPSNVWNFTLGGYQVLTKWLSYREQPLLGRPLGEDEARYFGQVVRRITAILLLSPALDASYVAILPTATRLLT
ncbi:MAG: type ISP restriction/modification enzyme [Bryobacteraceae bacterium]